MTKKNIIIIILAVAILLVLYFILKSKPVVDNKNNEPANQVEKVDLKELEKNYEKDIKIIVNDYSMILEKDDFKSDEVISLRDKLLALKLPLKYKDMHLKLVLSMSKIVEGEGKERVAEAVKIINELKANYIWLN